MKLKGFSVKRGYNYKFVESQLDRVRFLDCSALLYKDLEERNLLSRVLIAYANLEHFLNFLKLQNYLVFHIAD